MRYTCVLRKLLHDCFVKWMMVTMAAILLGSAAFAQTPAKRGADGQLPEDLSKYPELMPALGQLIQKIQTEVHFPGSRGPSRLLPLLPKSTVFYLAVPNYGDASHQALKIFQQEVQENAVLREWWHKDEVAKSAPAIEDSMDKLYQLSQYLGDEIVVTASDENRKEPALLVLAEVHKPGLKEFLQEMLRKSAIKPPPKVRILDVQELAIAKDTGHEQQAVILVRPDLIAMALDVATLRNLNSQLEHDNREFASTEFGQRILQTYEGGATVIGALDMQKMLKQIPASDAASPLFQRSGFADSRYLVWEHKSLDIGSSSQTELSFTGSRHGIASWLAAPGRMRSLDFVSPEATLASSVLLKDPAQIWDEIRDLASDSNPKAFAAVDQMESAMQINLKEDLLRQLGGEITVEVGRPSKAEPAWSLILSVKDPTRVQATLDKLLTRVQFGTRQTEEEGVTYHAIQIPSPQKSMDINYAFVDGYLVIASSHGRLSEAIRLHRSGGSLAESENFLAALPSRGVSQLSGMFYEDPVAMAAMTLGRTMPQLSSSLAQSTGKTQPLVICAYGEETALRETSRTGGMDAGMIMMVAAIAIPNLLRARIAANEASAAATIRTVGTAELAYSAAYPQRGYARSLAALGPGPGGSNLPSPMHASIIDNTLGNATCTAGVWCSKSGFNFMIKTRCLRLQPCKEFVVVGTPVAANTGAKNFCSTSDMVVRYQSGTPLTAPIDAAECQSWSPLQ